MLLLFRSLLLDGGGTPPEPQPTGEGRGSGGHVSGGPDAQVSYSDYMRRFVRKEKLPQHDIKQDENEALAIMLCALVIETTN